MSLRFPGLAPLKRHAVGRSRTLLGLVILVVFVVVAAVVFNKDRVWSVTTGMLGSADTVTAEFERGYKLRSYSSDVKIGGVVVGTVTDATRTEQGRTLVSMRLHSGVTDKLGTSPSAGIRPATMLGGKYYVELRPGGGGSFDGAPIPVERTTLPVELDRVLSALTPPARHGMRAAIEQTGDVLAHGGEEALRDLVQHAPGTLRPAGEVLDAAQGSRPGRDLAALVSGLEGLGAAMTRTDGQLGDIVESLDKTVTAIAAEHRPLATSVRDLPKTLRVTRAGLADLQPTLGRLTTTAEAFGPSARALDSLLGELDPVLVKARPLLQELRPLLRDLRPSVQQLTPVATKTTGVLDHLSGPVMERLEGPITDMVMSPWQGSGKYAGGGASGNPLYEELGYLASRASQAFGWHDPNGAHTRLALGVGANSVGGFGMSVEQYLERLGLRDSAEPAAGQLLDVPLPLVEAGEAK